MPPQPSPADEQPLSPAAPAAPAPAPAGDSSDLSSLSPQAVLHRPGGEPAAQPPKENRDELIRQAAEAEGNPLILPTPPAGPAPASQASKGELEAKSGAALVQPTVVTRGPLAEQSFTPAEKGTEVPLSRPQPAPQAPPPPIPPAPPVRPPQPSQPPTPPAPAPRPMPVPPAPAPKAAAVPRETAPEHHRTSPLVITLAVLLVLLVLAGSGLVLAWRGVRVPGFYQALTGLSTSGLKEGSRALAAVDGKTSYQYASTSSMQIAAQAGSSLPATSDSSGVALSVSNLTTQISFAQARVGSDALAAHLGLVSTGSDAVPVLIQTKVGDAADQWLAYFPLNAQPDDRLVSEPEIKDTLLYPALQPIPLPTLLGSVQKQTKYAPATIAGQKVGVYSYGLQADKLNGILPRDGAFQSATADISYAWKSQLPVRAVVSGSFTYLGVSYSYQAQYDYVGWNATLPAGESQLSDLSATAGDLAGVNTLSTKDFSSQLGLDFQNLPNELTAPVFTTTQSGPITPSGKTVTRAGAVITASPALPVAPATADMLTRDAQRKKDLADLRTALGRYKAAQGSYPKTAGLEQVQASATLISALVPVYMTSLPIDPLPSTFWYEYQSDGSTYVLRSVAEDASDPAAKLGTAFHYFEATDQSGKL